MRTAGSQKLTLRWVLNLSTVVLAALGICLNYAEPSAGKNNILYFTIQSNIWILGICFILCCYDWQHRPAPRIVFVVKHIFTAAIALTGVVYNLILAPQYGLFFGSFWKAYTFSVVLLHAAVPALGVISYLWFDDPVPAKGLRPAGCTMPLLYFAGIMLLSLDKGREGLFEGIGGTSTRFPYFFMDYETNGWFTLSGNIGEIGVFYWICAGLLLTLGLSAGLLQLKRKISRTNQAL